MKYLTSNLDFLVAECGVSFNSYALSFSPFVEFPTIGLSKMLLFTFWEVLFEFVFVFSLELLVFASESDTSFEVLIPEFGLL